MRTRWLLAAVTTVLAVPVLAADIDRVHTATTDRAVAVVADGCGPTPHRGAGVAIGADRVLTVAHVVAGADHIHVSGRQGRALPARPLAIDPDHDLALLVVDQMATSEVDFAEPARGDTGTVVTVADGSAERLRYSVADVVPIRFTDIYGRRPTERQALRVQVDIATGDSGAALVDESGAVAGLVFARSTDAPGVAYATAPQELTSFIGSIDDTEPGSWPCIED